MQYRTAAPLAPCGHVHETLQIRDLRKQLAG